jgi:hypothetical protein
MAESFNAGYDGTVWMLVMTAERPSIYEHASFDSETPLEIRFNRIDDVIIFSLKYPGEPPIDAPYTPHWADPAPFELPPPTSRLGYTLLYILMPEEYMRLIGLGVEFSATLYDAVMIVRNMPYNRERYLRKVQEIYSRYSPENLWNMAPPSQRYVVGASDASSTAAIPDDIGADELIDKYGEYVADAGAVCVYCVPEYFRDKAADNPADYTVPIPGKYLRERGYKVEHGVVYVDVPYGEFGVEIDEKYYE